jgi:hypothetical protein
MYWFVLVLLGIMFDIGVKLATPGLGSYRRGIDSKPAVPILAGYGFGMAAGFWSALILSITYFVVRSKHIEYAPLTIAANVLVGVLIPFLASLSLMTAALIMLAFYHAFTAGIVVLFSEITPGFIIFIGLNSITTLALIFVSSLFI